MRTASFGLVLFSLLTACKEEHPSLTAELRALSSPVEEYTFTADKNITITTRNGTSVTIPPGAFVTPDGTEAKELVKVEIKDVFEKSEMILNGLSTISDGRLLESFGMVWIKATSRDKELSIKRTTRLTVSIPNKRKGRSGELFYGTQRDSLFNWTYAGKLKDITEVTETYTMLSDGMMSVKRTTHRIRNGAREYVSDTVFTRPVREDLFYDSTAPDPPVIPETYDFEITKLGWINCDRFIDYDEKTSLEIELSNLSQPILYLIFTEINSVMPVWLDSRGIATAKNLPVGASVEVIAIDKVKDQFVWARQGHKIGGSKKLTLKFQPITRDKLREELRKLDQ